VLGDSLKEMKNSLLNNARIREVFQWMMPAGAIDVLHRCIPILPLHDARLKHNKCICNTVHYDIFEVISSYIYFKLETFTGV